MKHNTIGKFFQKRYALTPELPALGWVENKQVMTMSFREYRNEVEKLSLALNHIGLGKKDKLSILSPTKKEWHLIDIATLLIGGVVVPIYHTYTVEDISYILTEAEVKILVVQNAKYLRDISKIQDKLKDLEVIISLEDLTDEDKSLIKNHLQVFTYEDLKLISQDLITTQPDFFELSINALSPEDTATIIYTSGTTNLPKGAVITHGAFAQMLQNVYKFTNNTISTNDRSLCFLPLSHVFGRCDSYLPLVFGMTTYYAESIEHLFRNIKFIKPTLMLSVPRVFEKIFEKLTEEIQKNSIVQKLSFNWALKIANEYFDVINENKTPNPSLVIQYELADKLILKKIREELGGSIRYFISGGAPLSREIFLYFRNIGITILEGYGLTETVAPCFLNPFTKQIPETVGVPMGDVEVKFAEDGEIILKTKALFKEYFANAEETKDSFEGEWFKTGDIGHFTKEGYLKITDRKKNIIITSGGKNISPQKLENLLKENPLIKETLIIGDRKKYLTALIFLNKVNVYKFFEENEINQEGEAISQNSKLIAEIQKHVDHINKGLPPFETIKKFTLLDAELSAQNYLTPSLKIKRSKIQEDFKKEISAMY